MQDSLLQWFAQRFMERRLSPRELLSARKLVYIGLALVLFLGSFAWRRYAVEPQANRLALLEQSRGEVELSGSLVRLTLTGSRGLATCGLWMYAIDAQKKNQWNELEVYVSALTRLQPHFTTPWLFQSWNLSYNVSVESDRPFDKYFYIARGIQLLAEGEKQNQNIPEMRFFNGFYLQHKICQSDETNVLRSLYQLSLIPPSDRDPARFRKMEKGSDGKDRETINWEELEQFCKEHPRLARRLSEGIRREDKREQSRQFVCVSPTAMVSFLEKNWRVPSRYKEVPLTPRGAAWIKADAEPLTNNMRFPVLPPRRDVQLPQERFQPMDDFNEMTDDTPLNDAVDAQAIARAWYGYAQEPVPPPGDLPGSNSMPTDTIRQRRPKQMATLLFRQYPALCQTHLCQDLQKENWYDSTPWPIKSWFEGSPDGRGMFPLRSGAAKAELAEVTAPVGPHGLFTSEVQWDLCARMWERHAKRNHMIFDPITEEFNTVSLAEEYWSKARLPRGSDPLQLADPSLTQEEAKLPLEDRERIAKERERLLPDQKRKVLLDLFRADLDKETRERFQAALFMYELSLYRSISNFQHHYHAARVEARPETVKARRLFAQATLLRYQGDNDLALALYLDKDGLLGWRDNVLSWSNPGKDRIFREDMFVQEETFDAYLDYLKVAEEKESEYRFLILGRAGIMSYMAQQAGLSAAGLFTPVPVDLALLLNAEQKLQGRTFFPRPFDVLVVNPDTQPMFLPAFLGIYQASSLGLGSPASLCLGPCLLSFGGTRPLVMESAQNSTRDRRRDMQGGAPPPAPPAAPPPGSPELPGAPGPQGPPKQP